MTSSTLPCNKYTTAKCPLQSILKNPQDLLKLNDACLRTHQLVIHAYQFLRFWILHKYHHNRPIPIITETTFKLAFSALKIQKGRRPSGKNLVLFHEFRDFHDQHYQKLSYAAPIDGSQLSRILDCMATDMLTNLENNIKQHFLKYLKRFVNSVFKKNHADILEKNSSANKTDLRKQLRKDLFQIKSDLENGTLTTDPKYHTWILQQRQTIFPKDVDWQSDLENNPQNYLKAMIYMCLELEKQGTKSFQFFPLRNEIAMKSIPLETAILVDLLSQEDAKTRKKLHANIGSNKHEIWGRFFNLSHEIFKQNNYIFDYRMTTDCYAVSIQLIHLSETENEVQKKLYLQTKRNEAHTLYQTMTPTQRENYQSERDQNQAIQQSNYQAQQDALRKANQDKFKSLSKSEQDAIRQKIHRQKNEFPYLEDLTSDEYEELKNSQWCVVDPGLRDLLHIKGDGVAFGRQERMIAKKKAQSKASGTRYDPGQHPTPNSSPIKTFKYTSSQHLSETKRFKYQRLIQNYKNKTDISTLEIILSQTNSKSCQLDVFGKFIHIKNIVNQILLEKYQAEIFRQYKWYGYLNRKKAETNLVRTIKTIYGKDVVLCYGDYSKGEMPIRRISVPGVGLRRMLGQHFRLYLIDEYRTSCLSHVGEERCENLYFRGRKIHSVLTYQTESKRMGCINRDENATYNMMKIVRQYLKDGSRPERYRRGYQLPPVENECFQCVDVKVMPKIKLELKIANQLLNLRSSLLVGTICNTVV
jgi:hypothetical protein